MGSISAHLSTELIDHVFNGAYSPPSTVYLALSTSDPATLLSEPGSNYERKAIAFNAPSNRRVTQSAEVVFDQAAGSWGEITHWAVCDHASIGNIMASGALNTPKNIVEGNTPSVAAGQVWVEFVAGELSDYLAEALLNFAFRNQAFAQPDTYLALATATIGDGDTGASITEVSGGAYARQQINPNGGVSPTWSLGSEGAVYNVHEIEFPEATAQWGTVVAAALCDALTGGNLLFYSNDDITDQLVDEADLVVFVAEALQPQLV